MPCMDALLRVQRLIELAQIKPGDSEATINNARNAAWAACQLIRHERLAIVYPSQLASFPVIVEQEGKTPAAGRAANGTKRRRTRGGKVKEIITDAASDATRAILTDLFKG